MARWLGYAIPAAIIGFLWVPALTASGATRSWIAIAGLANCAIFLKDYRRLAAFQRLPNG